MKYNGIEITASKVYNVVRLLLNVEYRRSEIWSEAEVEKILLLNSIDRLGKDGYSDKLIHSNKLTETYAYLRDALVICTKATEEFGVTGNSVEYCRLMGIPTGSLADGGSRAEVIDCITKIMFGIKDSNESSYNDKMLVDLYNQDLENLDVLKGVFELYYDMKANRKDLSLGLGRFENVCYDFIVGCVFNKDKGYSMSLGSAKTLLDALAKENIVVDDALLGIYSKGLKCFNGEHIDAEKVQGYVNNGYGISGILKCIEKELPMVLEHARQKGTSFERTAARAFILGIDESYSSIAKSGSRGRSYGAILKDAFEKYGVADCWRRGSMKFYNMGRVARLEDTLPKM